VIAGFAWTGEVYAALDACSATRLGEQFGEEGITIRVDLLESSLARLRSLLRDRTRGEAIIRIP
jgi:hypothetical protein